MERFGDAFDAFLRSTLQRTDGWIAYAVFIASSGIVGLAVVLLDACSAARPDGASYLKLTHGWRSTPKYMIIWFFGSMLGAALGMAIRVFEPTPWAAIAAALTWPALPALLQRLSTHHVRQTPGEE
jgi:hypothetical protein